MKQSILTFDVSCSDKKYINNLEYPVQIMPMARGYVKDSILNLYTTHKPRNLLVHASYPILVFNTRAFESDNKIVSSIKTYFKFCDKIGASHFLVHGPKSVPEYKNFELGLKLLKDLYDDIKPNVKICVEMPSFTKEFIKTNNVDFNFIAEYFEKIIEFGFEIVIDTAHLWSNGMNTEQMVSLLQNFKDNYTWIHFNGNCKEQYTSDQHVAMFSADNKIDDFKTLSIESAKLGKICVCEVVNKHVKTWQKFAEKAGFDLVDSSVFAYL